MPWQHPFRPGSAFRATCRAVFVACLLLPAAAAAQVDVPADWGLIPSGLGTGDSFRLVFISSTQRDATSTSIDTYNTFVQTLAAAGHADIQPHSSLFKAVGCTDSTNATANTETRARDTSVPIFWLNGAKAADGYADFYDGSWDNEAEDADRDESGTNSVVTGNTSGRIFTGCEHNGTKAGTIDMPRTLGAASVPAVADGLMAKARIEPWTQARHSGTWHSCSRNRRWSMST